MICLDTSILIWGIRGISGATRGQEHMVPLADRYLRYLHHKKESVMIPTPVLSEYLVGTTVQERYEREIFQREFKIYPFDIPAAEKAAELQRNLHTVRGVQKEHEATWQEVKCDIMILAIAIYRGAEKVISADSEMLKKLAQGLITVEPIPEILDNFESTQASLFDEGS